MALFVHFTDENNIKSIEKNGIKMETIHYENICKGIFCMPVIHDFYATHQWVRELKQYNSGNEIVAVYFRIPDNELIFCGKYNEEIIRTNAAEAHNRLMNLEDKMGFQAIIDRGIHKNEITKIKNIPQIIGWRHFPKAHERKRCLCPACLKIGSYNSVNAKKTRLKELFKKLRHTEELDVLTDVLYEINDLGIKIKTAAKDENTLLNLLNTDSEKIKHLVIDCMAALYGGHYRNFYFENIYNGNLIDASVGALARIYGNKILDEIEIEKCTNAAMEIINEYKELYGDME
jgi:hypothetical protein